MEPETDTPGRAVMENFSNDFPPLKFQENIERSKWSIRVK